MDIFLNTKTNTYLKLNDKFENKDVVKHYLVLDSEFNVTKTKFYGKMIDTSAICHDDNVIKIN